jgi:hypothetical protein
MAGHPLQHDDGSMAPHAAIAAADPGKGASAAAADVAAADVAAVALAAAGWEAAISRPCPALHYCKTFSFLFTYVCILNIHCILAL